jgi:hypothetical protein
MPKRTVPQSVLAASIRNKIVKRNKPSPKDSGWIKGAGGVRSSLPSEILDSLDAVQTQAVNAALQGKNIFLTG